MGITSELSKTDKKLEDFEGQEPDREARLEMYCPRNNHNKFWVCQRFGYYVVRRWGRHGSKGQSSVHRAWNSWGAENALSELVERKRRRGYVDDTTTILDHIKRQVD